MSNQKHMQEPWPPFIDVAVMMTPDPEGTPAACISFDDYERARVCVNACQDIPTETLERVQDFALAGCATIGGVTNQRDTAWQELREIREAISANPEESTTDEVRRVVAERDELLVALRASDHKEHKSYELGPCLCSQCAFVRLRNAAIAKAGGAA